MSSDFVFTKRDYKRTDHFNINAKISEDGRVWYGIKVPNIAAGGLLILTDRSYKPEDELWLDMIIDPRIAIVVPVSFKLKGVVKVDRGVHYNQNMYAISFTNISIGDQIRLDELIHMAIDKIGYD